MRFREFYISDTVVQAARKLGMFGDVKGRIARMARMSAPFTHPSGNRRFESYVLQIEGTKVLDLHKLTGDRLDAPEAPKSLNEVPFLNPTTPTMVVCPDCEGDGGVCLTCGSTGKVRKFYLHNAGN